MATAREKVIESAIDLMEAQGYNSTSVDEIISRAGVAKGSFYHSFKSKEEVGIAALEAYFMRGAAMFANGPYTEIEEPLERVFGFVEFLENSGQELWEHGCMIGSFSVDLAGSSPAICKTTGRLFRQMEASMKPLFQAIVDNATVEDCPTAAELAAHQMAVIEGGIVMGKAHCDSGRISQSIHEFRRYLECLVR